MSITTCSACGTKDLQLYKDLLDRPFWCKGYYVDTVRRNEKKIAEYVRNQLREDQIRNPISLREYIDPFTDEPARKGMK